MPRFQANFHLYVEDPERAISFYTEFFKFEMLGDIEYEADNRWAALRAENAIIWLGKEGSSNGLILLIDQDIEQFVDQLIDKGVEFILPENLNQQATENSNVLLTGWGKHAWFIDSERNVVMLFQPDEE